MALKSPRFKNNLRLQNASNNNPTLKLGEIGPAVQIVQEALVFLGYPLPKSTKPNGTLDGVYGTETKKAIEAFQRKNNLVDDGIIGENTLAALDAYFIAGPRPVPIPLPKSPPQYELKIHLRSTALAANSKYSDPYTDTFAELLRTGRELMLSNFYTAKNFYKKYNIHLRLLTEDILKLTPEQEKELLKVEVYCRTFGMSTEQQLLYSLGPATGSDEVTAFFIQKMEDIIGAELRGCATYQYTHPVNKNRLPLLIVSQVVPLCTQILAHELGHLLLGPNFSPAHSEDPMNIMYPDQGLLNRPNIVLDDQQVAQIFKSPLLKKIA